MLSLRKGKGSVSVWGTKILQAWPKKKKKKKNFLKILCGDKTGPVRGFIVDPVVKNLPCNAGDMGLLPGWGTKIPHDAEPECQN